MTTLPASLVARFSSFAAVAALLSSTVLATGCADGADESALETDGAATQTANEAPRFEAHSGHERVTPGLAPTTRLSHLDTVNSSAPKLRKMGEPIAVPSGYVATAPTHVPSTVAVPPKMVESLPARSGYVATTPHRVPGTIALSGTNDGSPQGADVQLPAEPVPADGCDVEGDCPTE